ncbi:diacylglycerol kinase family enzyme [Terracoccus luteus]|uniref:Diacylglycerol kinase family enzyme n=1 Tax=Terracoccus luteus TaxID=53356 RepID=A0A495XZA7_9MICO|nr:diacylglycerol kinase family protein [Terracoccus luteus]RKT79272.1 diacylglycerol kinase family enzyme [Terracoccus luteus]
MPPAPDPATPPAPPRRRRLTVVYNPVKVEDLQGARTVVADACERHGWEQATWVPTTAEETGEKQAREAVEAGADCVASYGGDGTVRAVASALVGTQVALGLLPGGTGNLLARNLRLPVESLEEAALAVVGGRDRRIDVGLLRSSEDSVPTPGAGDAPEDDEEVFLVMAGLGLDGQIMAGTNEKVKGVLGWPAYVLSAARQLTRRGFSADVAPTAAGQPSGPTPQGETGGDGTVDHSVARHARTVLVGNCGTLQGGLELMPDARLDDGILDAVVLAPRGVFAWVSVLTAIVTRDRRGHRRLDRMRGPGFTVEVAEPVEAEIDGDPIGERRGLAIRVLPGSLVVRVG